MEENNIEVEAPVVQEVEVNIDYKDKYLRALADYKNLRRTTDLEKERMRVLTMRSVMSQFLPILDDIQRGAYTGDAGMLNIYRKAIIMLADNEIYMFGEEGEEFDSSKHNAISTVSDNDKPNNTIVTIQKNGFRLNDDILRYADVVVNKIDQN